MKRILFAADDSTSSYESLCQGAALLGSEACTVRVLSVIPAGPLYGQGPLAGQRANRAAEDALIALDRAVTHLSAAGHQVEGTIRVGAPAATIVESARDFAADLVVVGTHRYQGPALEQRGSVAADVFAQASCGVLVYPLRDAVPVA